MCQGLAALLGKKACENRQGFSAAGFFVVLAVLGLEYPVQNGEKNRKLGGGRAT